MILTCAATILINLSGLPWNLKDKRTVERARQRCKTMIQYKETPCLKEFAKKSELNYYAICGRRK